MPDYAELHCLTNFSFRRGASRATELVQRAHALGYRALAVTDECSVSGIVRAHEAASNYGMHLIVGAEFFTEDNLHIILLAPDQTGYSQICRLITLARRRAPKGQYRLTLDDLTSGLESVLAICKPAPGFDTAAMECVLARLRPAIPRGLWLGATRLLAAGEQRHCHELAAMARRLSLPVVACGDVRMHVRGRRALLDTLTALHRGCGVADCGLELHANGERHLRPVEVLRQLYPRAWLEETLHLADRCRFRMDELRYTYPRELAPPGMTPMAYLRHLTQDGLNRRWPHGADAAVRRQIEYELALIEELHFEAFFLTVHDIVRFARSRGILCQGRGSSANSAVCYCLGITEVDPATQQLLFERFLSRERNEPPDIDVDFEHERREEVLQYVYDKYGRERAALAATVICYRPRSALRDVGRALGLAPERINRLTRSLAWWDRPDSWPEHLRACGLDPQSRLTRQLVTLAGQLLGFPRHLSQHVGGMVIADEPLHHLVPVENAAMDDRTIIQWDKDDLETLGLLKVDCLSLGMLTALRKCMDLVNARRDAPDNTPPLTLARLPREDAETYTMLQAGDAVGVFQVESRAQMAMLPRLRPRCFYDLVIEVAIVRPGPIQGDMVHPYLERRDHPDKVTYPGDDLRRVLQRTLGIPIFQEQVMQIAIIAAGFTPGEADQLRRAMAAWKRRGGLEPFRDKLVAGMRERGYDPEFAERIYQQIRGFGDYGFPESHAASFALLTYFSAWFKCHHPAAFAAALINSQPMGFYAPAQLIADARRHGVRVRPVDVRYSHWDCTLENLPGRDDPGLRLGLRLVRGLRPAAGEALVAARELRPFSSIQDMVERSGLDRRQTDILAAAGALRGLAGHRHRARWQALAALPQRDLLREAVPADPPVPLPLPDARGELLADYAGLGLSLDHHPLRLLRPALGPRVRRARELPALRDGQPVEVAGVVTHRQRPGTASGVIFISLEDETGVINLIVWSSLVERFRREVLDAGILRARGKLQNSRNVQHVVVHELFDETRRLSGLDTRSRDFH